MLQLDKQNNQKTYVLYVQQGIDKTIKPADLEVCFLNTFISSTQSEASPSQEGATASSVTHQDPEG